MQIHQLGYGIRGFYRVASMGYLWSMTPQDAEQRYKILCSSQNHGIKASMETFSVSRRTLYRWSQKLKAAKGFPGA